MQGAHDPPGPVEGANRAVIPLAEAGPREAGPPGAHVSGDDQVRGDLLRLLPEGAQRDLLGPGDLRVLRRRLPAVDEVRRPVGDLRRLHAQVLQDIDVPVEVEVRPGVDQGPLPGGLRPEAGEPFFIALPLGRQERLPFACLPGHLRQGLHPSLQPPHAVHERHRADRPMLLHRARDLRVEPAGLHLQQVLRLRYRQDVLHAGGVGEPRCPPEAEGAQHPVQLRAPFGSGCHAPAHAEHGGGAWHRLPVPVDQIRQDPRGPAEAPPFGAQELPVRRNDYDVRIFQMHIIDDALEVGAEDLRGAGTHDEDPPEPVGVSLPDGIPQGLRVPREGREPVQPAAVDVAGPEPSPGERGPVGLPLPGVLVQEGAVPGTVHDHGGVPDARQQLEGPVRGAGGHDEPPAVGDPALAVVGVEAAGLSGAHAGGVGDRLPGGDLGHGPVRQGRGLHSLQLPGHGPFGRIGQGIELVSRLRVREQGAERPPGRLRP